VTESGELSEKCAGSEALKTKGMVRMAKYQSRKERERNGDTHQET
jgi:hypothetical protein